MAEELPAFMLDTVARIGRDADRVLRKRRRNRLRLYAIAAVTVTGVALLVGATLLTDALQAKHHPVVIGVKAESGWVIEVVDRSEPSQVVRDLRVWSDENQAGLVVATASAPAESAGLLTSESGGHLRTSLPVRAGDRVTVWRTSTGNYETLAPNQLACDVRGLRYDAAVELLGEHTHRVTATDSGVSIDNAVVINAIEASPGDYVLIVSDDLGVIPC